MGDIGTETHEIDYEPMTAPSVTEPETAPVVVPDREVVPV